MRSSRLYTVRLRSARLLRVAVVLAGCSILSAAPAIAEEMVFASGRVVAPDGRPMRGALVAAYDDQNKVVDYARTDEEGYYAISVPGRALHLDHHAGKGFLADVFGTITHLVGGAAGFVANPLRAGVSTVTNSQMAGMINPLAKGELAAGGVVVDRMLFGLNPSRRPHPPLEERKSPGVVVMKVAMPGRNDLIGLGRVYWLQQTTFRAGGRPQKTLQAWLDPVRLTRLDTESPSTVDSAYLQITSARIEPSLAQVGDRVRLSVKMPSPPTPEIFVVVVARDSRTGQVWELEPSGDDRYVTSIDIDRRFPRDDQYLSVIAYAQQSQRPGRRKDAEDAILRSGLWNPAKPFRYDPLLVVSRNRADVALTVLAPDKRSR